MTKSTQKRWGALAGALLAWMAIGAVAEEPAAKAPAAATPAAAPKKEPVKVALEVVVQEQIATDKEGSASQKRVEETDDETRTLLQKYNQLTAETKSMNAYSDNIALQVKNQVEEIAFTEQQLEQIEHTARDVLPMMERMVDVIDRFVALDIPFMPKERKERVQKLKDVMQRADVTISEKYRRIVEAYQIEMDFGRTLESYEGDLEGGGAAPRTVRFLRIGRVALLYQTLDGKETGYWDADKKAWVVDNDYRNDVKDGVAVALKQGAPELLIAPMHAPEEAQAVVPPPAPPAAAPEPPAAEAPEPPAAAAPAPPESKSPEIQS